MRCEREWPIPNDRDRRAIDVLILGLPLRTGVEAETTLTTSRHSSETST